MNEHTDSREVQEAEETLRLVARISPPEELTDRVHARLAAEGNRGQLRGFWALWQPAQRLQFAAAAVLVVAVAGTMWSVYRSPAESQATGAQLVQPKAAESQGSGFNTSSAVRVPPTLKPIPVPVAPKRKAATGHKAAKPSPGKLASRSTTSADGYGK